MKTSMSSDPNWKGLGRISGPYRASVDLVKKETGKRGGGGKPERLDG